MQRPPSFKFPKNILFLGLPWMQLVMRRMVTTKTCFLDTLPTMWMLEGWMPRLR